MARLREVDSMLDNHLKAMNDKIKRAAKVSTKSKTYKNLVKEIKTIISETNQPPKFVTVNGQQVPQVSRASGYYKKLDVVKNAMVHSLASQGASSSISREMESYAEKAGKVFSRKNSLKEEFREHLAEEAREKARESFFDSETTMGRVHAMALERYKVQAEELFELIDEDIYNEKFYVEKLDKLEEAIKEEKEAKTAEKNLIEQELEKATSSESILALKDALKDVSEALLQIEEDEALLSHAVAELLTRKSYAGIASIYFGG